jgi:hypothetical protein
MHRKAFQPKTSGYFVVDRGLVEEEQFHKLTVVIGYCTKREASPRAREGSMSSRRDGTILAGEDHFRGGYRGRKGPG